MSDAQKPRSNRRGPLAWFARNPVAANILVVVFLLGGYLKLKDIKQEVFPEFDLDMVVITIPYPGASPEEVEEGVVLATEEAVRGVDGVKRVTATASEGAASLVVELLTGTDPDQALNDVKAAVDRVTSFPENAERPVVYMLANRFQVISLVIYGDQDETALRALAEKARDDLLRDPRITVVSLAGVRPLEISVEVPQETLVDNKMTLDQIAAVVRQSSIDLPGGGVKTSGGEVLVRTTERRDRGLEFEKLTVLSDHQGAAVKLGDIAEVKDGFAETDESATFNGKPAVMVNVFRVGDQTPLDISQAVRDYVSAEKDQLPPGVDMSVWSDTSEFYQARLDMLVRNATYGLILVILTLGIFLEIRLAFWVTIGIPVSFIGTFLFLPSTGVSINMLSMFAFIVVLGMVVDDAIVIGEAIYKKRQEGVPRLEAAIQGVREVAVPVVFAVITTMMAFAPMLFVPGIAGKFFKAIPIVVIIVLGISLFESLLILPAHLAHSKPSNGRGIFGFIDRQQQRFSRQLERWIERFYVPVLARAARRRYLTLAIGFALLIGTMGVVVGGHIDFTFMTKTESDVVYVAAQLPYGAPVERTREVEQKLVTTAREIMAEHGGEAAISRGIFSQVGSAIARRHGPVSIGGGSNSHIASCSVFMVGADKRPISAARFAREWRAKLRDTPGVERLSISFETGMQAGAPVQIELNHRDTATLHRAARELATRLEDFDGVYDIDDGFTEGKEQLDLTLKPVARSLGITEFELARQVRAAFFGVEAVRQQRGRDEIRVYVRLPKAERESEYNIEELLIRPPGGGEIRLSDAAWINRGRSRMSIERIDGRKAVAVQAQVDDSVANSQKIMARVTGEIMPALKAEYPGLGFEVGGESREMGEVMGNLASGFLMAVLAMFALLAIAFRSYIQPVIIMLVIPFGFVGAVWGHLLMGFDLSLISMMGVVALAGVVVNDSLLLVVTANQYRVPGVTAEQAVVQAGARRFRPIILTSLTTFFGLAPMIFETSLQARFLIPMAVSLGFGIIFATMITLLMVPAVYMVVEDARRLVLRIVGAVRGAVGGESTSMGGDTSDRAAPVGHHHD